MGDAGDYWRESKEHNKRQQRKYQKKISGVLSDLISISKVVGDHWRIGGVWDFWYTGTTRNIKTGDSIDIHTLAKKFLTNQ